MGYIYIYKSYISQKVAIFSEWTVCPCFVGEKREDTDSEIEGRREKERE